MRSPLYLGVLFAALCGTLFLAQQAQAPSADISKTESPTAEETPAPAFATTPEPEIFYHEVLATVFWVGEGMTHENDFIANAQSAWDSRWEERFGGVDDPLDRCGYRPCAFVPRENPFYVALPYDDLDLRGGQKSSARYIPWYMPLFNGESLLKNRWVEVRLGGRACFAQWEDVGPFETDDFDYVFGDDPPKNIFGVSAGIDLSPALRDCLRMEDNARVGWRFVEEAEVPAGPWRETITSSGVEH